MIAHNAAAGVIGLYVEDCAVDLTAVDAVACYIQAGDGSFSLGIIPTAEHAAAHLTVHTWSGAEYITHTFTAALIPSLARIGCAVLVGNDSGGTGKGRLPLAAVHRGQSLQYRVQAERDFAAGFLVNIVINGVLGCADGGAVHVLAILPAVVIEIVAGGVGGGLMEVIKFLTHDGQAEIDADVFSVEGILAGGVTGGFHGASSSAHTDGFAAEGNGGCAFDVKTHATGDFAVGGGHVYKHGVVHYGDFILVQYVHPTFLTHHA